MTFDQFMRHAQERLRKLERRLDEINADLAAAAHSRDEEVVRRRVYVRLSTTFHPKTTGRWNGADAVVGG